MRFLIAFGVLVVLNLFVALGLPGRAADAGATLRLDLPGLVACSELVLEGRVLGAHLVEGEGTLATEYLVEVQRTWKGADLPYRSVRLPGGTRADGSGLLLPGVPALGLGEELVLFLGPTGPDGTCLPAGLSQGHFRLRRDAQGKKELRSDSRLLGLVDARGRPQSGETRLLDYADFVAVLEALVGAGAGR